MVNMSTSRGQLDVCYMYYSIYASHLDVPIYIIAMTQSVPFMAALLLVLYPLR